MGGELAGSESPCAASYFLWVKRVGFCQGNLSAGTVNSDSKPQLGSAKLLGHENAMDGTSAHPIPGVDGSVLVGMWCE